MSIHIAAWKMSLFFFFAMASFIFGAGLEAQKEESPLSVVASLFFAFIFFMLAMYFNSIK